MLNFHLHVIQNFPMKVLLKYINSQEIYSCMLNYHFHVIWNDIIFLWNKNMLVLWYRHRRRHLSQGGCIHRQHTELAHLDTLNISHNEYLKEIQVTKSSSTLHVTTQNTGTGTGRSRGSSASSVDSTNSVSILQRYTFMMKTSFN